MERKHNPALTETAKQLRKNMTPEERKLWYEFLHDYPVRFLRQKVVGDFIVDFYCARAKLVIEIDGAQHFDAEGIARDRERTERLNAYGLYVLRVANHYIRREFDGVCKWIDEEVQRRI